MNPQGVQSAAQSGSTYWLVMPTLEYRLNDSKKESDVFRIRERDPLSAARIRAQIRIHDRKVYEGSDWRLQAVAGLFFLQ